MEAVVSLLSKQTQTILSTFITRMKANTLLALQEMFSWQFKSASSSWKISAVEFIGRQKQLREISEGHINNESHFYGTVTSVLFFRGGFGCALLFSGRCRNSDLFLYLWIFFSSCSFCFCHPHRMCEYVFLKREILNSKMLKSKFTQNAKYNTQRNHLLQSKLIFSFRQMGYWLWLSCNTQVKISQSSQYAGK